MADLQDIWALAAPEHYLAVVSTVRADGSPHSSLVNAGPVRHPTGGETTVGFVTYGKVKLANLRARPQISLVFRAGWRWLAVDGRAEIIGPDDPAEGVVDDERLRLLLREIFTGAGGTHDDWAAYDAVMREQRRAAVLVTPSRVYGN